MLAGFALVLKVLAEMGTDIRVRVRVIVIVERKTGTGRGSSAVHNLFSYSAIRK